MITPLTLLITTVLCVAMFRVPRRHVLTIYIIGMCFVPADQAVVIAGLDFKVLRIFAFAGCVRIFLKGEFSRDRCNTLDWLFILWALAGTLAYLMVWGTVGAVIYKMGTLVDTLMLYYVFRAYIRDLSDIERAIKALVGSMVVMTPFVMIEHFLGMNPFYVLGRDYVSIRDGRIRCSGAFSHAILLGSFAASVVPLSIALLKSRQGLSTQTRNLYILGIICSAYVTIASASSGPVLALLVGVGAVLCFRFRSMVGVASYGLLAFLVMMHFAMKAPIWHLFSRIDVAGGSTGFHRYYLYDQTVNHFGEWVAFGVKGVHHWGVHAGDVTSMYVAQAVFGGVATLIFFVWMLVLGLRVAWKSSMVKLSKGHQWLVWGFFCSLLTHAVSFLSVAYFGQITMLMTLSFAICAFFFQHGTKLVSFGQKTGVTDVARRRPLFTPP